MATNGEENPCNGKKKKNATVFIGTFVHCKSFTELEILENAAVWVGGEEGRILAVERDVGVVRDGEVVERLRGMIVKEAREGGGEVWERIAGLVLDEVVDVRRAGEGEFWFPGFIDTHIHASQYANTGLFGQSTLLSWLETYTFPMESSLTSLPKANQIYKTCIRRTLQNGTTCASYFATIDVPSTNLLADLCLSHGQRAFIGRVCMDALSPEYYRDESVESCISKSHACIDHIKTVDPNRDLICPIITPRFAPSCTAEMLSSLGDLQKETNLPVQTHISENKAEIQLVKELFPDSKNYTDVYDKYGLLTDKTILAHGVHLDQMEVDVIRERKSKISHCPVSNTSITSGLAKIRWLLDNGIDVGLGTDVSGGYSTSILEAVRQALLVSRCVAMGIEEEKERERVKLRVEEGLWLATRGGARVVGLEGKIGGFEVGMEWDAQLIGLKMVKGGESDDSGEAFMDNGVDEGLVDVFGWDTWHERVEKWVFSGDDRNTKAVWVKGKLVHERGLRGW